MAIKKMNTLVKKLESAGIHSKPITLVYGDKRVNGIKINTEYEGLYPDSETFNIIHKVENIGGNNFKYEPRGYYTALYITEV